MIVPRWSWFVTPSGGPVQPGLLGWLDGIKRRPIVAHPVGAAIVVLVFVLLPTWARPVAAALLAEGVNQWYKAVRGVYGTTLWLNVIWRMMLALAGGGLVALVLG